MLDKLYKGPDNDPYFQKSRVFLYPVLETKKGGGVTPINTYVSWEGNFKETDQKLICTFYLRNDPEFKRFEKISLFGNELFYDFREGVDGTGIYIFDFAKHAFGWKAFIDGKYSRMGNVIRERVKKHFNTNNANAVYVDSFINPAKYYEIYARLLNVRVDTLIGGELCDKPHFEKEKLKLLVKEVKLRNISLDLSNSKNQQL